MRRGGTGWGWGGQSARCGSYLVQSQHVEVADVVLLSVSDPRPALLLVDHLPHVFADKMTLRTKSLVQLPAAGRRSGAGCSRLTFLMSWAQRRPQPRDSVRKISTWLYWRLVKAWLRQRSPAGQTFGSGESKWVPEAR